MITPAQLDALAQSLSWTSSPSTTQPGVVQIQLTPDLSTLSLTQIEAGQAVTALLKFVRFADAELSGLATWSASITDTALTSNVANYTFSGATDTPKAGQTVRVTGCSDSTYNVTATIATVPDSTHFTIAITHPDIAPAGGQTGLATADIITNLTNNLLGGQPMPAIQIPLLGPGLLGAQLPPSSVTTTGPITGPGGITATITSPTVAANPALPALPDDSGLTSTARLHDLLAGVPGIVAHVEQRVLDAISVPVTVAVTWTLKTGDSQQPLSGLGPLLNFLPNPVFARYGPPLGSDRFDIEATVTVSAGGVSSSPVALDIKLDVPRIGVPLLGGIFTWRTYGTQSFPGDNTNPDDDSMLLMIPADSPVADVPSILNYLNNNLVPTLQGLASTFGGSLTGIALDPAISSAASVVGNLTSALGGIGAMVNALRYSVSGHPDFKPVVIVPATTAPASSLGGIADINDMSFDSELEFPFLWRSFDHYHDHVACALLVSPPGLSLELDHDKNFDGSKGQITMTAGAALFVGIRDFTNVSGTIDPSGAAVVASGSTLYKNLQSMKFLP